MCLSLCVFKRTPRPNAISVNPLKTHGTLNLPEETIKPSKGKWDWRPKERWIRASHYEDDEDCNDKNNDDNNCVRGISDVHCNPLRVQTMSIARISLLVKTSSFHSSLFRSNPGSRLISLTQWSRTRQRESSVLIVTVTFPLPLFQRDGGLLFFKTLTHQQTTWLETGTPCSARMTFIAFAH